MHKSTELHAVLHLANVFDSVIVVLVNFANKTMNTNAPQYFRDLFFSQKKVPTSSVTEYYGDVSGGKISITGDVVGPFKLPQTAEFYANGGHGIKGAAANPPNVQTMANDAVSAVEAAGIDLKKYDNKHRADGYVDAFIIVHAGRGGEETKDVNDIWSCKWNLPGRVAREVGSSKTKVYPFLTIPEDARLGVCAHEIGHLIFGWPDLYDISSNSRGIGAWCLMSGGSWGKVGTNPQGTTPCHPSAWCKLDQEWVDAMADASDVDLYLNDVKANTSNTINANRFGNIHKLWSNGQASNEYFLIENRTRSGYDASLPGEGLLSKFIGELRRFHPSNILRSLAH
jgi:immune inhibitor A